MVFAFFPLGFLGNLSWSAPPINQDVSPVEPEDDDYDLPDRERGVSGAGDQHGDPGFVRDAAAVRAERLWVGALPGAGAAGHATAVLRPDAAAYGAAYGATHGAAGGVSGLPAKFTAHERQQPGVRPDVPAAEHAGGEQPWSAPSPAEKAQ